MAYPSRTDQIPDVFVHLYRGKTVNDVGNPLLPVAFWRISAEELLKQGFNVERPQWITLVEDKSIDQVKDRQFPGNLLIMLAMGKKEDWEECTEGKMTHREKWQKMTEDAQSAVNYQLRVHLYQARDIPDADFFGGGVDPYFKVNFNGQQNDGRKEHFIKNNDPLVYKTIIMDKDLTAPKVAMYMPQVNIQVWDWDPSVSDSFNSDDYLGCCFHTFTEDEIIDIKDTDEDDGLPIKPPRWIDLMNEEPGDSEGSVLASFQLIRLSAPDQAASFTKKFPPPLIIPKYRPCAIEILCMGIRDMAPYEFMSLQLPSLHFKLEAADSYKVPVLDAHGKPTNEMETKVRPMPYEFHTNSSKRPTAENANFLERLVGKIQMPEDPLFAPPLNIIVTDSRLGGFHSPEVGKSIVKLDSKCFWNPSTYIPPDLENFDTEAAEGGGVLLGEVDEESRAKAIEAAGGKVLKKDPAELEAQQKRAEEIKEQRAQKMESRRSSLQSMQSHIEGRMSSASAETFNPIVLTEHVNFDEMIRPHVGQEDAGTGVFGSLHHTKNKFCPKKRKKNLDPGEWEVRLCAGATQPRGAVRANMRACAIVCVAPLLLSLVLLKICVASPWPPTGRSIDMSKHTRTFTQTHSYPHKQRTTRSTKIQST